MIFSVAKTIAFLSQGTTLERGTVIMLGTPPGVGAMRKPRVWLKHGDDMRVYIDGIGKFLHHTVMFGADGCRHVDQRGVLRVGDMLRRGTLIDQVDAILSSFRDALSLDLGLPAHATLTACEDDSSLPVRSWTPRSEFLERGDRLQLLLVDLLTHGHRYRRRQRGSPLNAVSGQLP